MTTHTFTTYKAGYTNLLSIMRVTRIAAVDAVANRLVANFRAGKYGNVPSRTGIPAVWIAASFEREASSNFSRSPAQGDKWNAKSTHVPVGRGPFRSWTESALDAYHLDGLDKVGAGNWTWELCCWYGELFNGFGYRAPSARNPDGSRTHYPPIPSPYLWGGTSIQQRGKYVLDGKFEPSVTDTQLGIIPIMRRMIEIEPTLDFTRASPTGIVIVPPLPSQRSIPVKPASPQVHPATVPVAAAGIGLAAWAHQYLWVIALIVAVVAGGLFFLHRKAAPAQSPKAIEPEPLAPTPASPPA